MSKSETAGEGWERTVLEIYDDLKLGPMFQERADEVALRVVALIERRHPGASRSPTYEACVTVIAAARSVDRAEVSRDEVNEFWGGVQKLERAHD